MGSQDYIKFNFIKYDYNSKDSHPDGVDPEEKKAKAKDVKRKGAAVLAVELDVVLGTHLTKALGASSNASISS